MAHGVPEGEYRKRRLRVEHSVLVLGVVVVATVLLLRVEWIGAPQVPPGTARSHFTAEYLDAAQSHASVSRLLGLANLTISLLVLVFAVSSTRVRATVRRVPGPWWVGVPVAAAAVLLVSRILTLPLAFVQWRRRVEWGVAADAPALWARDVVTGWTTSTLVVLVVVVIVVGTRRRWQRAWSAVAGAVLATGVLLGSYVHPIFVAPLSHSFSPLPQSQLREEIERLAVADDVAISDVVVADASRRGSAMNAWISGFGETRQVVLYDTLVDEAPTDVVLSVVAHELAHAQHGHVLTGTLLGAGGVLIGVGLLGLVWPVRPGGVRPDRHGDPWHGVLLVAAFGLAMQATVPVQSALSRAMEREADRTAVAVTGDPEAFVALQVLLAERAFSDPEPPRWSQWWWGTHPTTVERMTAHVPQGR